MKYFISKILTVGVSLLISGIAYADVVLESATLGVTGLRIGFTLGSTPTGGIQSLGARFQVTEETTIECIGGHIHGRDTYLYGAIVALTSENDLPDGSVGGPDFICVNLFDPETYSTDLLVTASLVLPPGYYAVIFGSKVFGADCDGAIPPIPRLCLNDLHSGWLVT